MTRMRRNMGGAFFFFPRAGLSDTSTNLSESGKRVIQAIRLFSAGRSEGADGILTLSPASTSSRSSPRTLSTLSQDSPSATSPHQHQPTFLSPHHHRQQQQHQQQQQLSAIWMSFVRSCSGGGGAGAGAGGLASKTSKEASSAKGDERVQEAESTSAHGHQIGGGGGDSVDVVYFRGLPQFTVPLPSRRESCRFIVKPLSNTVGDLLNMIREEDRGVDRVALLSTKDGVRIGASNTIEMLMENDFDLVINDKMYRVITPPQEKPSPEEIERLSSVRNLVGQLYAALNVDEHQLRIEREMLEALEKLQLEVEPLEKKRQSLAEHANKRTNVLTWVGLGLMSVQFGILARLTWWEYSWDIMEPVTYFVTYGTAMLAYAYFVLTKQEYVLPEVKDRQYLIEFHKNAKKAGLDVRRYNDLKDQISSIETDLKRLRDPLALHLPLKTRLPKDFDLSKLSKDSSYYSIFHKMQMMLKK